MQKRGIQPGFKPPSVGEILTEEFLNPGGISQGELAKAMGVSRKTVNELCGGKRKVTVKTAVLLEKALGMSSDFWLELQCANDQWEARHNKKLAQAARHARSLVAP